MQASIHSNQANQAQSKKFACEHALRVPLFFQLPQLLQPSFPPEPSFDRACACGVLIVDPLAHRFT